MFRFILFLISAVFTGGIVFCFYMAFKTAKKSQAQQQSMVESKAFGTISQHIFSVGRPSQIFITLNNEIFFGPVEGSYQQVPSEMIPPMDHLQRYSLGNAFAKKYGYSCETCFGPQGQNFGMCQTGNGYLDSQTDILVHGSVATGTWN